MKEANFKMILHSGKDLKYVKHLWDMHPYAKVWIDGDRPESTYITKTAIKGGVDPVWEWGIDFGKVSVNKNNFLFIEIQHDGTVFDRKIGVVQLRFEDLLAGDATGEKVTYSVTIASGEKKGEVKISYKFTDFVVSSDDEEGAAVPKEKKDGKGKRKVNAAFNLASRIIVCIGQVSAAIGAKEVMEEEDWL